ncbi:MAG: DNA replication and repair protein RecF [Flavobacteriales bacterium]|nr:DNA replication and repair protein RecF [Flavobacteriales bacterium]
MILKLLSLVNFKNHESLQIDFSPKVNCFLGNNGVGKTNLLDAIHYLSFCKSYYNVIEADNIKYGERFFMLKGEFLNEDNTNFVVDASLKEKVKHFKYNSKKYDKLSDHIGKIPLVIITPLDSNIILGGGDERRKFIDRLLSQLDNTYLYNLMSYNKVLQQRNALLKEGDFDDANLDLLSTYDKSLSDYGYQIYLKRKDCLDRIIGDIQNYYSFISEKQEFVNIIYKSQLNENSFEDILIKNRTKDKLLMFTSAGVHRDDFIFTINSHSLKKSGSQGQQKTFLISLKFAYYSLLKSVLNIDPLLLLDDIFDKLDTQRVEKVITMLNQNQFGQIFITDTSFDRIDSIMSKVNNICKYFLLDKGGVYEEKFKN